MTAEQIAQLAEELNRTPRLYADSHEISEALLTRTIAALAEYERDRREFVAIPRMD